LFVCFLIFLSLFRIEGLTNPRTRDPVAIENRVQDVSGFMLHYYGGKFHRVPREWRFPRCGVHNLWRQWWIGGTCQNIPPLQLIKFQDVEHINVEPLSNYEKQRKAGPNKNNRRKITKLLYDLNFLCKYLTSLVKEMGRMETVITLASVDRMFSHIAYDVVSGKFFLIFLLTYNFFPGFRNQQKHWLSVAWAIFRQRKKERETREQELAEIERQQREAAGELEEDDDDTDDNCSYDLEEETDSESNGSGTTETDTDDQLNDMDNVSREELKDIINAELDEDDEDRLPPLEIENEYDNENNTVVSVVRPVLRSPIPVKVPRIVQATKTKKTKKPPKSVKLPTKKPPMTPTTKGKKTLQQTTITKPPPTVPTTKPPTAPTTKPPPTAPMTKPPMAPTTKPPTAPTTKPPTVPTKTKPPPTVPTKTKPPTVPTKKPPTTSTKKPPPATKPAPTAPATKPPPVPTTKGKSTSPPPSAAEKPTKSPPKAPKPMTTTKDPPKKGPKNIVKTPKRNVNKEETTIPTTKNVQNTKKFIQTKYKHK
jgi:hypothetical protein